MQEINERDLQNVSGGGELHWYDSQAKYVCSKCQREAPGKCAGSLDLMIQYIRDVDHYFGYYIDCPYFRE